MVVHNIAPLITPPNKALNSTRSTRALALWLNAYEEYRVHTKRSSTYWENALW